MLLLIGVFHLANCIFYGASLIGIDRRVLPALDLGFRRTNRASASASVKIELSKVFTEFSVDLVSLRR